MTTYATFTEDNEWEGETWRFYIPVEGNEASLQMLADRTMQMEGYGVDLTPLDEATVDARVAAPDDTDYMAAHNKLAGTLSIPTADDTDLLDVIYKGGIADLVK